MICWDHIETVLLDMDGTLLDLYFDNFFWMELVPQRFAEANHISLDDAKTQLFAR
ncbi:MAG TPA: HAD family hydrolase, partial [Gammaproteobacteria bacterium]|nr:HAD family hydrolase [Gammaproteobacteria bacterium]